MRPEPGPEFLAATPIIDWQTPTVLALAAELSSGRSTDTEIAEQCFVWVRDQIRHSMDYGLQQVTCTASEVLQHRTGFCYAKSHLLAALLRANHIPAALAYQRLSLDETSNRFCLHGLNAVFLNAYGWFRLDARGEKPGIQTPFCPPVERLAYRPSLPGEMDLPELFAEPLRQVVTALNGFQNTQQLAERLPDLT